MKDTKEGAGGLCFLTLDFSPEGSLRSDVVEELEVETSDRILADEENFLYSVSFKESASQS